MKELFRVKTNTKVSPYDLYEDLKGHIDSMEYMDELEFDEFIDEIDLGFIKVESDEVIFLYDGIE